VSFFRFASFVFKLRFKEDVDLGPFPSATIYRGLKGAVKELFCPKPKWRCERCLLLGTCFYSKAFGIPSFPPPLVINTPSSALQPDLGEEINFTLTLIGEWMEKFPHLFRSVLHLAEAGICERKGRFEILEVISLKGGEILYEREADTLSTDFSIFSLKDFRELPNNKIEGVVLSFLSPLLLRYQGRRARELTLRQMVRELLYRIKQLMDFYCGGGEIKEAKELLTLTEDIITEGDLLVFQELPPRHPNSTPFKGLKGKIRFRGDISPFLPFLRIGEFINLGEGASLGFGNYRLQIEGEE